MYLFELEFSLDICSGIAGSYGNSIFSFLIAWHSEYDDEISHHPASSCPGHESSLCPADPHCRLYPLVGIGKNIYGVYSIGFGTIFGCRHPLGVLECTPLG